MFWHALPPSLPNTRASGVTALPNHYTGYRCGHRWQRDEPKMILHTYFSVPFSEMSKQFSQLAHKTKKCVDETGWWECVCVFDGVKAHTQPPRCHISKPDSLELLVFVFFSQWGHKASAQWRSHRVRVQQSVKSTYYCILTPCCDCLEVKPSEGL